jgi:TOMM system kinase/cyclase fusion protein
MSMTVDELLAEVVALLRREGRISYRLLKRRFALDDEYLADLKAELIDAKRLAADEDGKVLVWIGNSSLASRVQSLESKEHERDPTLQTLDARPQTLDAAGDRRQLTVMFCDLVGSTALSAQLDPEELHAVIRAYQEVCAGTIGRFAGHIAQYLGDGLLVYFGYPAAHEDDAARAVRAGLEIITAIQKTVPSPLMGAAQSHARQQAANAPLPHGRGSEFPPLHVRIGIHTGPVVVTGIGGSGRQEQLALGETPNIAARIQGHAAPDTVMISAATFRLVQGLFDCQSLGEQELKGLTTPLALYQVQGAGEDQSHFEAATRRGLTPLVGREHEASLLLDRWAQVKEGQGQVVLVSGEAGIGKSRLVQLLKERVAGAAQVQVECRCSPYYQNSALYPVITHMQKFLQFGREEAAPSKLHKLERMLSAYQLPLSEAVPLMAALFSLPHPDGYPALTFSPQKQKQRTLETLLAWLLKEAERQPVRVVWEDLHWADPTTLEFVRLLIEQAPTTRMLVLATFRPEFQPPWGGRSHITQITLNRLSPRQVEAMVGQVTGGKALPAEVVRQILLKTDGVPLFVEELTKMVLESGLLRETDGHYEFSGPLPPLAIPSTLQDSLMARLDRLASVREVAQLGAILGREFSYELLHAVSPLDEHTLQNGLTQLVEAELLYQRGAPPHATYIFKHALIQDTAYQSLLKSRRQRYHQQIAQVLEEQFPETIETQPELLAHHYTEAGLTEQAIPYWQQAGQRASEHSANVEAISHLAKALELLKSLPDTPERAPQELALQTTLGPVFIATKGWAAPETGKVYARARELCQQVSEPPQLFRALWGLYGFYVVRGEFQTARELAEQLLGLAESQQNPAFLVQAYFALGLTLLALGELSAARMYLEQGSAVYDPQLHSSHAFLYGHNPGMSCLSFGGLTLWHLGYPDQALNRSQEAVTLAQQVSHLFSLAYALNFVTWVHQYRGERQATREQAEAVLALSTGQEFPFWVAYGNILRGWTLTEQGQGEEGIAQVRHGLAAFKATGSGLWLSYCLALLAEACGNAGQAGQGLTALAEALAFVDKTGERYYEAELYRLKGELTLAQSSVQSLASSVRNPHLEAEACFLKAIEIARRQSAKSLELRAVMNLAKLWRLRDKQKEAHQMLSEVYNWFTEGFDTKDLREATALLAELTEGG